MNKTNRRLLKYESMVIDELVSSGYPKESIILEWKLDARRFVDFVVIDVETGIPVMMIEVKTCSDRTLDFVKRSAFESLKKYYFESDVPIKAVAAILSREEQSLEFIDFTEAVKENDFEQLVSDYSLLPYETLTTGARRKAIKNEKDNQNRKITILKILCWIIIPFVCVTLVLLDALDIYNLSTLRLIVIGAGVVVAIIPCYKEIKIGEIWIKQQIEKQKKSDD